MDPLAARKASVAIHAKNKKLIQDQDNTALARGRFGSEVHETSPKAFKSGPLVDDDDDAPMFGEGLDTTPYMAASADKHASTHILSSTNDMTSKTRKIELIVENQD